MGEGTATEEVEGLERLCGVLGAAGIVPLVAGVDKFLKLPRKCAA